MRKNKFNIGDLVEITNTESAFKAHPDMLSGKLAVVMSSPSMHSSMFVYYVLVDGHVVSVMEEHLKEPHRDKKTSLYGDYTD